MRFPATSQHLRDLLSAHRYAHARIQLDDGSPEDAHGIGMHAGFAFALADMLCDPAWFAARDILEGGGYAD